MWTSTPQRQSILFVGRQNETRTCRLQTCEARIDSCRNLGSLVARRSFSRISSQTFQTNTQEQQSRCSGKATASKTTCEIEQVIKFFLDECKEIENPELSRALQVLNSGNPLDDVEEMRTSAAKAWNILWVPLDAKLSNVIPQRTRKELPPSGSRHVKRRKHDVKALGLRAIYDRITQLKRQQRIPVE